MTYQLLDVQKEAIKRAAGHDRFGWFLEMGLGKTLLSLHEFSESGCNVMMICCPPALVPVWKSEVSKWGFDYDVHVKPMRAKRYDRKTVLIYNYESLIASAGQQIEPTMQMNDVYLVFDESVAIKNFKSERWKKIRVWHYDAHTVRLLSGRPMVQSPMDLWSQLRVLGADIQRNPYAFKNFHCLMGGYMNKQIVGVLNEDALAEKMADVSWQARKVDWLDLPEKMYTERHYEMSAEQKAHYMDMLQNMIVELEDETITVDQAVHRTMKLQQITSGFINDEEGNAQRIIEPKKNNKVQVLLEQLEQVEGKSIIFAYYKPTIYMLEEVLGGTVVVGGMGDEGWKNAMDTFNNTDEKYIICQVDVTKYGWTLLGNDQMPCHNTFYFENNYSLDARIQSEDRNHRHGQKNPVLYTDIIGTPIEMAIVARLQEKKNLSDTVMDIARGVLPCGMDRRATS
jgi:SNF2 family DNA or RNA helicase